MKIVEWTDEKGFKRKRSIKDTDPDEMAQEGLPLEPPDVNRLDWDNLKVKLLGKEKSALVKRHTDDVEAYNIYLRGIYFNRQFTAEGFKKAVEYFEKSLQKDPKFGLGVLLIMGISV